MPDQIRGGIAADDVVLPTESLYPTTLGFEDEKVTLKDLLIYTRDGEWGAGDIKPDLIPMRVIRGADFDPVSQGNFETVPTRYIEPSAAARKTLRPWDILIETAGGGRNRPTGRTLLIRPRILQSTKIPVTCASFARFLRIDDKRANPEYIYWFLQYLYSLGEMERNQVQHTGVARFQFTSFAESIKVPLLPFSEQDAIARILGTFDDKIELNRRINETLETMARALFKSWFVDFDPVHAKMEGRWRRGDSLPGLPADFYDLFPDRLVPSESGEIPKGWEMKTVGEVVDVVGGTTPSTKVVEYWSGGIHSWATPKDLSNLFSPVLLDTERKITEAGLEKIGSGLLPTGTVLLSSRAPIGYVAVSEVPVAINQGFIAMPPKDRISNLFLLHWCNVFHDEIVNHANGSTFLEISKGNFRRIPMLVFGESVMKAFDMQVRFLHLRIATNEHQNRTLVAKRDALLAKLVSGELRLTA